MKIALITFFFGINAFAATQIRFFPGDRNAMVIITPTDKFGNADSDSTDLYQIMNVPEQDTMLGKGKSIISAERDFNMVCGEYKSQCQFIFNKSANVKISSGENMISFTIQGPEAKRLVDMFKLNDRGEVYFQAVDKEFILTGDHSTFLFKAAN